MLEIRNRYADELDSINKKNTPMPHTSQETFNCSGDTQQALKNTATRLRKTAQEQK